MNNFETKKKIVEAGASRVFKEWAEHSTITMEEFIRELEWLCNDPIDGGANKDKMTREIALTPTGIKRLGRSNGLITTFYEMETGRTWNGEFFELPLEREIDRIHNGKDTARFNCKISLSCKDRI